MDYTIDKRINPQDRKMLIFEKIKDLTAILDQKRKEGKKIGFVPTMGALHDGHISLVQKANSENDVVVVSIFVNPTQFNNQDDLKNYPRTPEKDHDMLDKYNVDMVFSPEVPEIYNTETADRKKLELGKIADVMEGAHRPGHFAGVVQIVSKLFDIVKPDHAYFGEKDFQQLAIIRYMVKELNFPVKVIACPTIRERNGLAMSSRNLRLSEKGLNDAAAISRSLIYIDANKIRFTPAEIKQQAISKIESSGDLKVEYLEIADEETLQPINKWGDSQKPRAFAAVFCEGIRLIDNVKLY